MSVTIQTILNEEGDGTFSGEFRDKDGALISPDSVFYSLNDKDGNIQNNIDNEELTSFDTSWEVELWGDDLSLSALETDDLIERYFFIKAVYGEKQDTNEAKFYIKNLKGIKT